LSREGFQRFIFQVGNKEGSTTPFFFYQSRAVGFSPPAKKPPVNKFYMSIVFYGGFFA